MIKFLDNRFIEGKTAIFVENEDQYKIVIDYAKNNGIDIGVMGEIDLKYPYIYVERNSINLNASKYNISWDGYEVLNYV